MKHNWEYKRLGEVCEIKYGTRIVAKDTEPGDYKVYGGGGATFSTKFYNREDCMIVSRFAMSSNCVRFVKGKFFLNDSGLTVNSKTDKLLQEYVDKFLWASQYIIYNFGRGLAQKNLDVRKFLNLPVFIPSVEVQERIVAEFDSISEGIAELREQVQDLDSLAKTLFYETFGDPISNPKAWPVKKFGDLTNSISYGTSAPSNENGKYPYIRMNNITDNGYLDFSSLKYIDVSEEELEKYLVREGDILFNRTNSREKVGKTAHFNLKDEMVIAGYIIRVRANLDIINPIFAVRYLNLPELKKYLRKKCRGAVNQANINSKEMASIPFIVPHLALQQQFAKQIEEIEAMKRELEAQIAEAQTLLDSRMDYWFN